MRRTELKMQRHVIDSYHLHGGYASKWDAEHAKGKPDLVCTMPGFGGHLVEVKHRPDYKQTTICKNLLEPRQKAEAKKYIEAGGKVYAGIVIGGHPNVSTAMLAYFDPLEDEWPFAYATWATWNSFDKFNINRVLGVKTR
jgi:hypothetical protein